MRILYLTQYFPPEIGATQTRAYEMAQGLQRAGHHVTILTEFPNHPTGIIPPSYDGKWTSRETLDGLDVFRVWVKASPQKNFKARIAFYLSYMLMAAWAGLLLLRGKYDAIYATSPPLFVGGSALAISYLRRIPLFFEVRDLWPESAVSLGELNNPRIIRIATQLEEACYRRAQRIIVVTENIRRKLIDRGFDATKIHTIPNGANTDLYQPQPLQPQLRQQLGLPVDSFVVVYTGLHGLAHGLETAVLAAEALQNDNIFFLFVGNGPRREAIIALAQEKQLTNTIFHEAVPEADLPAFIGVGDLGLDTRRKIGITADTLPVKMFTYMACQRPVLLAIEGEGEHLLKQAQAGYAVPPEDVPALVATIRHLCHNPHECAALAQNGRAFVEKQFSRQQFAHQLAQILAGEQTI